MTPPSLDSLAGAWITRARLEHLPSLRNQWGQAHVNADLASLSWLALPPLSGGYHTGALRINGRVPAARRFRWSPWGVERQGDARSVRIRTDTRLGYEASEVFWRVEFSHDGPAPVTLDVEQELYATVAVSTVDWGWLYGTPWTAGHHHDFYTTERIRADVLRAPAGRQVFLPPDERWVRLGRPRVPGIQRDEDSAPMLLEAELPDHTSPDSGRVRPPAARAQVRFGSDSYDLTDDDSEFRVARCRLDILTFEVRPAFAGGSGVLLTHGNHPDSAQVGLVDGRPWLRIAGEYAESAGELPASAWSRLRVVVSGTGASLSVDDAVVAVIRPWWQGTRWKTTVDGSVLSGFDTVSGARSAYSFSVAPDSLSADGPGGVARWRVTVHPGQPVTLGVVLHLTEGAEPVVPVDFDAAFDAVADRWRQTWLDAFEPGNPTFSGHLPVLGNARPGLLRTYYLGALLAIYMRNTRVSPIGPVFLTGGPRLGATTTFYWDQCEWARTAALLEPVGTRAWILAALAQPYDRSHSFDTRNLVPIGNHYAANDLALFRAVQAYVGVTADLSILDERAGGTTVLDHLREIAYRPRKAGDTVLVDFGRDPWELLECVPNYRDVVVSFNAGYVGLLNGFGALLRHLARVTASPHLAAEAATAETDADRLAAAVLRRYAGEGRWKIGHPDHDDTIGHVLDFVLVAAEMPEYLSDARRAELVEFVMTRLVDGNWMRALDPADPIAPKSDRPDHGAAGAFAAWPGATAYGLCRLGRPDLAEAFLGRLHASVNGGLWGQAVEAIGGGRFRVAERGVANRDSNAAVAVTEAVLAGLFGIDAGFASLDRPTGTRVSSCGRLSGVRANGFDLDPPGGLPGPPAREATVNSVEGDDREKACRPSRHGQHTHRPPA